MPIYSYKSIDVKGKKTHGFIDAISLADAKEKLRKQGVFVTDLTYANGKGKSKIALNQNELIAFTTQLAGLLSASCPLYESLLSLEEQYRKEKFHPLLLCLCDEIKKGASLNFAMQQFPETFSPLYRAMIAAGEAVGALDITLQKLALFLSKQMKFKKQLLSALLYPSLLLGFSSLVIILLLTFVIPSLEVLFEEREVNGFTRLIINVSHFFRGYWMIYIPLFIGCILGIFYASRKPDIRLRWHALLLKVPVLSTLIVERALARFCRTMGTLLEGGVNLMGALQISRKIIAHPLLEKVIEQVEHKIVEGRSLSGELKKSPLIPKLLPRMLAIGEEGGKTEEMLSKIADIYEENVEKVLFRLMALVQPIVLILIGALVGAIMLAVLLPLTDINSFIEG